MRTIIPKTLLLLCLIIGCTTGPYTITDDFTGTTILKYKNELIELNKGG
jgi:hypothetical protein